MKTRIGLQDSVMAFIDPFAPAIFSMEYRRTGEGLSLPVQDGAPSQTELFDLLRSIGVDFLMHHVFPDKKLQTDFINIMEKQGMNYLLGNEFLSINTGAYDIDDGAISCARQGVHGLGVVFDESEHLQLHPEIYSGNEAHPWANPGGLDLEQLEDAVVAKAKERCIHYGMPIYSEQVFPSLFHPLCRGGLHPVPKLLKEEFQSLQLATALGAAVQYQRDLGICIDLWGFDVGSWFTRLWGFPGHSPLEFENSLKLAHHFVPSLLYVENMDVLCRYHKQEGFSLTEYGDILQHFIGDYIPNHSLPYTFDQAKADIAFVRADDGLISETGGFFGRGMYGAKHIDIDPTHLSVFAAWHYLGRGKLPNNGLTQHLTQRQSAKNDYPVTNDTLKSLPLEQGVTANYSHTKHGLFQPLNGVLVFDQFATYRDLCPAKLIVLAGSRMSTQCLSDILLCVEHGTTLLAVPWLLPAEISVTARYGKGQIVITTSFDEDFVHAHCDAFLGNPHVWRQRFGQYDLAIENPMNDGESLIFTIRKDGKS